MWCEVLSILVRKADMVPAPEEFLNNDEDIH